VLEALWQKGACSVREIQETFPEPNRPAYTTVQTVVYRLERKKALRYVKRISNANIFEAVVSRKDAERRLVDQYFVAASDGPLSRFVRDRTQDSFMPKGYQRIDSAHASPECLQRLRQQSA
jgi:predicted transcriptional regulator